MEEGDSASAGETVYERGPVWLQASTQTGIETNSQLSLGGKGLDQDTGFNTNVQVDHDTFFYPDPNSDIDEEFCRTCDLLRS